MLCSKCGEDKPAIKKFFLKDTRSGRSKKFRLPCKKCMNIYTKNRYSSLKARARYDGSLKRCSCCKKKKHRLQENWSTHKVSSDGLASRCNLCSNAANKEYGNKNIWIKVRKNLQDSVRAGRIIGNHITDSILLVEKSNHQCCYCKIKLGSGNVQIDHIKPYSRFGPCTVKGLQLLCRVCNTAKSNLTEKEFFKWVESIRSRMRRME